MYRITIDTKVLLVLYLSCMFVFVSVCVYLICDLEARLQQYGRKFGVNFCCQPETEASFGPQHI